MMNVLIVDDNKQITSILTEYIKKEGYNTVVTFDGAYALDIFSNNTVDLILLDVMIPSLDGFEVCKRIRKSSNIPIIMITARGEDYERIMGLDIGADDYIVKPFSPGEVMARIRAVLRRMYGGGGAIARVFTYKSLKINLDEYIVSISGNPVSLTKREIELLWTLSGSPDRVFTRENLLSSLWGYDYGGDIRTVDSHITRLRAKLSAFPYEGWDIKTIWGVGYKFEKQREAAYKK